MGNGNIASPCIGQCGVNEDDICMGCYRSGLEIAKWFQSSEDEKREIIGRCEQRKQEAGLS